MDRVMVYTGALPQTADILNTNKFAMFGLGYGMQMVLGLGASNAYCDGLACLPTSPTPDLHVNVQVGSIYQLEEVDANPYSDLGTDTTSVVKQGINPSVQILTITPPGTSGQSQVFLVQVEYSDVDTGSEVESYFNSSNPTQPFSGPANAGTSNFSIRQGKCVVALKAGVAAPTGTQVTPAPDSGFFGLWAVTVANGQTQITSPNIVAYVGSQNPPPIVPASGKLPQIPLSVQQGIWMYGVDTSIGGNAVTTATTSTSSAVLTFGVGNVPAFMANGLKVYDQTTPTAITGGQTVQSFTTSTVTLTGNVNATVGNGDTIVFSNDLFAATLTPLPTSLVPGMAVRVKLNSGNVGAATFNPGNGLGASAIHRAGGAALSSGDLVAGMIAEFVYDGSFWQIQNFLGQSGSSVTNNNTFPSSNLPYGLDTSTSANTITVSPTPALPGTIAAGQVLIVKLANAITGATTINITGVSGSPFPVVGLTGNPLNYGAGRSGEMLWMLFDGANFQIINPPLPLQANLTIYVNPTIGNDNFDGTQPTVSGSKGPLQHIQTACNKASNLPPSSSYSVTIQCSDGAYNESVVYGPSPGPTLVINGNVAAPSNVAVQGLNDRHVFAVEGPNFVFVQNVKATTGTQVTPGTTPCGFAAVGSGATMITSNTVTGFCFSATFLAANSGLMFVGSNVFTGNTAFCFWAAQNAALWLNNSTVFTMGASITVNSFAFADANATITVPNPFVPVFVAPGAVTGLKFSAILNGVVNTQGEGVNYFPGSLPGSLSTGGQYN